MFNIALKMLFRDRAKYFMLVGCLTFASLLMTQQSSIFAGLMRWTTATLQNTQSAIWVMDPRVEQVNEVKMLRSTDLFRVRSVPGVAWAVPFYSSIQQARLFNGYFKSIQLIGLDDSSLLGAPPKLIKGSLKDLRQSNGVIIDIVGVEKLSEGRAKPLTIGDVFEINDQEARIVGICETARSFYGYPFVFTTYTRATQFGSKSRNSLTFILAEPKEGISKEILAKQIEKSTGLKALTDDTFFWNTIDWFIKNTGIPISFGTTIVLGFIVGVVVAGQTFYSFVLENLGSLGALKAMGASQFLLTRMLLLQAFTVGFIGFGIGAGLAAMFGFGTITSGQPPFFMSYSIPLITFGTIMLICMLAALAGICKISKLDASEVFRG